MSNYPDGCQFPKEPTEAEQWAAEEANEVLNDIINLKRELLSFLETTCHKLKPGCAQMRAEMQECFDEAYYKLWHDTLEISCSLGWPAEIPPFELLSFETPQEKINREWKEKRIRIDRTPTVKTVEASIDDIFGGKRV